MGFISVFETHVMPPFENYKKKNQENVNSQFDQIFIKFAILTTLVFNYLLFLGKWFEVGVNGLMLELMD